ncbi:MAG: hypothetical protein NT145_05365, partial [Elusimicrobia bacterium]|nr:hypothetical protein [Elusimicrobiota bacterium]
ALFVKGLREKKGIEKSFWAKKFIQSIVYSKEKVVVNLNTFTNCLPPLSETPQIPFTNKKEEGFSPSSFIPSQFVPLGNAAHLILFRTVDVILPNMIHGCKSKDI